MYIFICVCPYERTSTNGSACLIEGYKRRRPRSHLMRISVESLKWSNPADVGPGRLSSSECAPANAHTELHGELE